MYTANLVALMVRYPLVAGERAVDEVRRATKFLPSEAELYDALEHQVMTSIYAAAWERQAAAQIADRRLAKSPTQADRDRVAAAHAAYRRRDPVAEDEATHARTAKLAAEADRLVAKAERDDW